MPLAPGHCVTLAKLALVIILVGLFGPISISETEADERPTSPEDESGITVAPYEDSGYEFLVIGSDLKPPAGFEGVAFQDARFKRSLGAFGSGGSCPLQNTVATSWPVNTQLLVRRELTGAEVIPAGATNVRIMVTADNDIVGVFMNGQPLSGTPIRHEGCPILDEFRFDVPPDLILTDEPNVVAYHLRDRGGESFFDSRILYEFSGVERFVENAMEQLPSLANRDEFQACLNCSEMSKKGRKDCIPDPEERLAACPPPGGATVDQMQSCARRTSRFADYKACVENEGEEADANRREQCLLFWDNIALCELARANEGLACAMQSCPAFIRPESAQ